MRILLEDLFAPALVLVGYCIFIAIRYRRSANRAGRPLAMVWLVRKEWFAIAGTFVAYLAVWIALIVLFFGKDGPLLIVAVGIPLFFCFKLSFARVSVHDDGLLIATEFYRYADLKIDFGETMLIVQRERDRDRPWIVRGTANSIESLIQALPLHAKTYKEE